MSEPKRREEELFLAALEISDTMQRAAYLKGACGKDTGLHAQLLELLAAHDATQGPLDRSPAASFQSPTVAHQVSTLSGTMIAGKYKLVDPIGEGGMGSVWLAEQREPVKRLVAIKLIKAGMDSKAVLARFEAERQALALMDHPNIARILDGGVTESGLPYFVMELVKGVPITQFCDARKLTPQQRLELFIPVCQAIQHAHQKGIIHRDIKPSNVMVSLYDDRPVPKVIDFGVAKATGHALTEQTLITGFSVVGTPQYMSPEQATFNQLDIDTRSDIYSLGVLLYELLVGSPPFQKQELEKAGYLEILRVIREEEPPRPSTKLSTAKGLPSLSASRSTEPKKLTGLLRNELDWIVMKALEKDRTRRYETANGFAADVQRYLAGEQVLAHPPSVRYRIQKFVRRNRGRVLAAGLLLAALMAGITGTTVGLVRATKAESKATTALGQVTEEQSKTKAALGEVIEEKVKTEQALVKATEEEQKAKATDADSRKKLARQYVDHGWKLINNGNVTEALHWYIAAFAKEQDLIDKDRERVHRTRIAATMEACPRPTHILFHTAPVRQAAYSPDGRKLVTLAWDTDDDKGKLEIRVWDTLNGQQIGPVISPSAIADLRSSSATLRFDGSGSKIILVRSLKSIEKIEGPLSVLDIWDAMTGLKEGSSTGMLSSTALHANPAQQKYIEIEYADKTKPVWPPKLARLVDLDTLNRIELPPVLDSWKRAVRIDPTSQYCFVPPGNEGDCELWALSPLRRISRWGGGSLTGRTASGEMQFPRLNVRFAPDGSRLVAVVDNAGQAKTTIIYSIETATGRELFPPLVFPARLQGQYMVNISADATRIIIDANDKGVGGLRIYDTGTGKVIATYQPQPLMSFVNTGNYYETRTPHFVIVSAPIQPEIPAGNKRLNTSSTGFCELMDAATGKPISPPIWCEDAAYSPDMSKLLTLDEQGAMKLWNVLSGKPIAALVGTKGKVSFRGPMASKFSPSNRFVSILTDESIRIWDTQTGQPTSGLLEHRGKIVGSEFNPKTEQFFTLSEDGTARLWDPIPDSTAKETVTQTPVGILETDAAGEHVAIRSTLYGAPISVWDVAAGNKFSPATSLNTDEKTLLKARDLHFAGSGQTVFASNDISGFRIWESASGRVLRHVPTRNGEQIFAARSYDGRRLVTVRYPDGEARWWDAVTGQPLGNITPGDGQPIRLGAIFLYRPNPYLVTLQYRTEPNKALEVEPTVFYPARDTPTKLPWRPAIVGTDLKSVFQPLPLLPNSLNGRTLDPRTGTDGLSAGWRLVDDASNRELASLPAGQAEAIAGGNRFVIEELDKLSVWDSATGASISRIPLTPKVSYDFRFNRDGDRVVLATMFPNPPLRSAPQLWNLTTGRPVCAPWTQSDPILGFEWSPDGRRIATWAGPVTQIWDSETGQMTGRPISHSSSVMQVRFSPDGKSLTTVIQRSAAITDRTRMVSEGQSSKDRSGRSVPSSVVANSPLGVSGGLVFLWDVATGESIAPPMPSFVPIPMPARPQALPPFTYEIGPLFSSDGRRLFTTPTSRSVRAWMVPLDDRPLAELVTTAEALSGRRFQEPGSLALLSSEEWKSALNRIPGTTASIRTPEQQMARDSERAETLYAEYEWEGSLSHLNSLIAAESSKAKHFQMRGWCRYLLGIPDDALADMNRAIELGAEDWEIWAMRGTIYAARNQFELAAEDYRKMARFPDATVPPGLAITPKAWWADVARLLSWAGHPKEYRWACDRLLAIEGLKPLYTNGEFIVFLNSPNGIDDYTPIISVCRDELEKDKRAEQIPKLKSRLGLVLLRANQFAEAAKIIESIDPNDLPTSTVYRSGANELVLAIAYHHLGDRDQAEQHLQKGLEQTAALEKDIQSGVKTASTALLLPLTLAREAEQLIRGEPKAGAAVPSPLSTSPPTLKNSSTKP